MSMAQALAQLGVQFNLTLAILGVGLLMARVLPVIILSPVFGGEAIPNEVKIGLGLLLALVLFPLVAERMAFLPASPLSFVALLLKELFLGVCLAFIVNIVFEAARIAGTLVDTLAGTSMAQLMVPQLHSEASIWSSLQFQLAVVLFLTLNGHHLVISALADSLRSIPIDGFPSFPGGAWPFFATILRVSAELFAVGVSLCAPVLLIVFLTDVALGMINKVAPQIQVYFMAMSIKPVVATLTILVSLRLLAERLVEEFESLFRFVRQALSALA